MVEKQSGENKFTVLLVEDERPLVNAIKEKLERAGMDVVTARRINQGIEYMEELKKIDAVWLDHYLLGNETGLDFVAKIKSNEAQKNIPIFVVSNTGGEDKRATYLRLGAERYYVKAENQLEHVVQELLQYLQNDQD